jgi:DNA-directed RNA polymerase subunit RPC12/RpoP
MDNSQTLVAAVARERRSSRWRAYRCTECGAVLGPEIRTGAGATLVARCPICRTPHRMKGGTLR